MPYKFSISLLLRKINDRGQKYIVSEAQVAFPYGIERYFRLNKANFLLQVVKITMFSCT